MAPLTLLQFAVKLLAVSLVSFRATGAAGVGAAVGVGVGGGGVIVAVGVALGVAVGVAVAVALGVEVAVAVGLGVGEPNGACKSRTQSGSPVLLFPGVVKLWLPLLGNGEPTTV